MRLVKKNYKNKGMKDRKKETKEKSVTKPSNHREEATLHYSF